MNGSIRAGLALLSVLAVTPPLAALQLLALRSGRFSSTLFPRLWHRLMLKALDLRVHTVGQMAPQRPLILAANHVSWTDILALGAVAEASFIARSDLGRWPVIGPLSRLQRCIYVEREARSGSSAQVGQIADRLAGGDALVLFAEGTTGDGNTVLPFKSTLFAAAGRVLERDAADTVFMQPVAISYDRIHGMPMGRTHRRIVSWIGDSDLVPHLLTLLREGGLDMRLEFGEVEALSHGHDRKSVARRAEQRVRQMRTRAM